MDPEMRMTVRLPQSVTDYLDGLAKTHYTSRNAQILRIVRERIAQETQKATPTQ